MPTRTHYPFFHDPSAAGIKLRLPSAEPRQDSRLELLKENRCSLRKTRILRCSTLVNPNIVQRAKQRGVSNLGQQRLLTEQDQNRIAGKLGHLLDFEDPKPSRQKQNSLHRVMTESVDYGRARCVAKNDLRNLKVAIIGVRLL